MASFNINLGIYSSCDISVKRAGDVEERFLTFESGEVTFTPVPDNFVYVYNVVVSCDGDIVYSGSFSFSCNLYYQIIKCYDGKVYWTNVPYLEPNQVYYLGSNYYYYNTLMQEFNIPPSNYVADLSIYEGEYIECNPQAEFSYEYDLSFTS